MAKVALADSILQGSTDSVFLSNLAEAQANLAYAESDESGGAHNADYVQSLLNDAINKAQLIITDVDERAPATVPESFTLSQNYPNPFNPTTQIVFFLPRVADVRLEVFNLLGQKVTVLLSGSMPAGEKVVTWNGCNSDGRQVTSGVYFYRLTVDESSVTRKMMLLR